MEQTMAAPTFMHSPYAAEPTGAKVAVVGIPFDCGTHPTRIGARLGPAAIRAQSPLVRPYLSGGPDENPLTELGVVDCGDLAVTPGRDDLSFPIIEKSISSVVSEGAMPLTFGGDGAVTLPQLRALGKHYPDLAVLHIDAHTDTFDVSGHTTATTFTRAAEEGVIDVAASTHLGARGTLFMPGNFAYTRSLGYELIDFDSFRETGIQKILAHLHEKLRDRPIYLCFDMDFFDPSCAPGVCMPTWGGATASEGLSLLRGLGGLNFVAFDINTVSPPHDPNGQTAFLAGTVAYECLWLAMAKAKLDTVQR